MTKHKPTAKPAAKISFTGTAKPNTKPNTPSKRKVRHRWAPKSEWKTYILRIANAQGYRVHGDAVEVINYHINWLIDQMAERSKQLLGGSRRKTYNRDTVRTAATSILGSRKKLVKYALNFEAGCFRRFDEQDYVVESDSE